MITTNALMGTCVANFHVSIVTFLHPLNAVESLWLDGLAMTTQIAPKMMCASSLKLMIIHSARENHLLVALAMTTTSAQTGIPASWPLEVIMRSARECLKLMHNVMMTIREAFMMPVNSRIPVMGSLQSCTEEQHPVEWHAMTPSPTPRMMSVFFPTMASCPSAQGPLQQAVHAVMTILAKLVMFVCWGRVLLWSVSQVHQPLTTFVMTTMNPRPMIPISLMQIAARSALMTLLLLPQRQLSECACKTGELDNVLFIKKRGGSAPCLIPVAGVSGVCM
jgi:hypothetical protein